MTYRVVKGPIFKPSHLAMAKAYPLLEDAVRVMGSGVVVADGGRVVAFHESHLTAMTRLAELVPCSCATHSDGSVTKFLCARHAETDPCLSMSSVTGKRRTGTIRRGACTACGWERAS